MRFSLIFLFIASLAEARSPVPLGSFTSGNLQLYKVVSRDNPGWADGTDASYNANFDILSSTISGIINGTLSAMTTNYIQNRNTLQSGATAYPEFLISSNAFVANKFSVGVSSPNMQGINANYGVSTFRGGPNGYVTEYQNSASATTPNLDIYSLDALNGFVAIAKISADTGGSDSGYLRFLTKSTGAIISERMRITYSGIGMYTQNPEYGLDVSSGFRVTGAVNLPVGATNYLDLSGSTQTKTGGFRTLGAMQSSSMTVGLSGYEISMSTDGRMHNNRPCASGFTRRGFDYCEDTDGQFTLSVDSAPDGPSGAYATVSFLPAAGAVRFKFHVFCSATGGTATPSGQTRLWMRPTGSAIGLATGALKCDTNGNNNYPGNDHAEVEIAADANGQADYVCRATTATGSTHECVIGLAGYYEGY